MTENIFIKNVSQTATKIFATQYFLTDRLKHKTLIQIPERSQQIPANNVHVSRRKQETL